MTENVIAVCKGYSIKCSDSHIIKQVMCSTTYGIATYVVPTCQIVI